MINITEWMNTFTTALDNTFGERIYFTGLQGSYARQEATDTSDIDVVVILDMLKAEDILTYDKMLDTLPHRELICGFISGKSEIMNWETSDLFQFYHDTKPVKGNLDELIPLIKESDIDRAIKTGVCNIYHGCVHNMLHDKKDDIVRGLYKSASFVIQAKHFRKTGEYIHLMKELMKFTTDEDRVILEIFLQLKKGEAVKFNQMSEILFNWSKKIINKA